MKREQNLLAALDAYKMLEGQRGILLGYSGGADSSVLLHLLKHISDERGIYLHALHVHHGIRGAEADRDAEFCRNACERIGVDFTLVRADVPNLAKESGRGVEETARAVRYDAFVEKARSDARISCIATAHNADDNAETVIFNMARGSGIVGLCGIAPVREFDGISVIRPLLYDSKRNIIGYCEQNGIEYIFDSTNADTAYTRNYIRHEIMPRLEELNPSLLSSVARLGENLRADADCLDGLAKEFVWKNVHAGKIDTAVLASADKAVAYRVIRDMFSRVSGKMLEGAHIDAVLSIAQKSKNGASVSLVGGVRAVIDGGQLYFTNEPRAAMEFECALTQGVNDFSEYGFAVVVAKEGTTPQDLQKYNETLQNIYKLSIHAKISFDKIKHTLFLRSRRDGDAYVWGGMTRKLKKLYNDRAWSAKKRSKTPVFCDGEGIVWVPEFFVADRVKPIDGGADIIYYYNGEE